MKRLAIFHCCEVVTGLRLSLSLPPAPDLSLSLSASSATPPSSTSTLDMVRWTPFAAELIPDQTYTCRTGRQPVQCMQRGQPRAGPPAAGQGCAPGVHRHSKCAGGCTLPEGRAEGVCVRGALHEDRTVGVAVLLFKVLVRIGPRVW